MATALLVLSLKWRNEFQLYSSKHLCLGQHGAASIYWEKPIFPFIKVNVDGAVCLHTGVRGFGVVLQNDNGDLMMTGSKGLIGDFSPKAIELYVTTLGLQLAFHGGFDKIILEMDSQGIVQVLQKFRC